MTTVPVFADPTESGPRVYRASARGRESYGGTIGQAIDGLPGDIAEDDGPLVVMVHSLRPDRFFNADQQKRLAELMDKWRLMRDTGGGMSAEEQSELDDLVEAELRGATERSADILRQIKS